MSRRRDHNLNIRLTRAELDTFKNSAQSLGMNITDYFLFVSSNPNITVEYANDIHNISTCLSKYYRQIKGACTNLNQLTHVANINQSISDKEHINKLCDDIKTNAQEIYKIWQSSKQ